MKTKFDIGQHVGVDVQVVSIGVDENSNIEYGLKINTSVGSWVFHANEKDLFELPSLEFSK